jgi:16S rRNA (cytidine1402-2'-O)-methyltransferase
MAGMLYIVATPIGNLEDITLRALRVLREVDIVLCEDTRQTKKLLARYDISKETLSYHAQSAAAKEERIVALLKAGKDLALVSDAGTPTISDPGARMVHRARQAGIEIIAVPGPSAGTAALSISGFPASDFLFLGFLPNKKGRAKLFEEIAASRRTVIFYESPHRILKTLRTLNDNLTINRKVVVGRELTKMYEEVLTGSAMDIVELLEDNPEKVRGEFVVLVSPA